MRALALIALLGLGIGMAGCGRYAVRPDEKEFLADRIMQPDSDPVEAAHDQHIFTNREGSAGGAGAGGGGCGCN
jgi:hypothetical protein